MPEAMSGERFVVATKLHIPVPRPHRATRRSLVAKVREATHARLVVVSATAGSGKTTLLASWHADPEESRRFAWLSLDERDNDPVCFSSGAVGLDELLALAPHFQVAGTLTTSMRW